MSGSRSRSAWPWVVAASVLAALLLCVEIVVGDWGLRTVEARALVAAVQASEQVMTDATDDFKRILDAAGSDPDQAAKEKMATELQAAAASAADRLRRTGEALVDLRIAPWNRRVETARRAYQAHNAAWQAYLDAGAQDPTTLFTAQPDIESTWNTVTQTLPAVVPAPDVLGLGAEVSTLITDGSASDDGGGSGGQSA